MSNDNTKKTVKIEFIVFKEEVIEKLKNITITEDYSKIWDVTDFAYFLMRFEEEIVFFTEFSGLNSVYYNINKGKLAIYKSFAKIPNKKIDIESIAYYLRFGFFPEGKTFYKNVFRILPGRIYKFKKGIISQKLINIPENPAGLKEKPDFRNFGILFENIISSNYYEKYSTIMYSGGIDSTCMICALKNKGKKVNSLSVRFNEKEFDEDNFRRDFIKTNCTNHKDIIISPEDYVKEIIHYIESSQKNILTATQDIWAFSHALKKSEIEYNDVYFGLGGDEYFAGYSYMTDVLSDFSDFKELFDFSINKFNSKGLTNILLNNIMNKFCNNYSYIPEYFDKNEILELTGFNTDSILSNFNENAVINNDIEDFYKKIILFEYYNKLPCNYYARLNSIENLTSNYIKTPFGNPEILTYSLSAGMKASINNNKNKFTLYNMYKNQIPENILNRKKQGFKIPLLEWIKSGHFDFMKPIITEKLQFLDIDSKYIEKLYKLDNPELDKEKLWLLINLAIMI
ncbi:MAG: asparagine synthase-related protein [Candidatus Muirbacterium halophilum]|nr:asparagine synthase-related protein [Candidatus Muirbacterium halophilum]